MESKVIQEAAAIVFTADETLKLYQDSYALYADKMHLIHNSFDYDFLNGSAELDQNNELLGKQIDFQQSLMLRKIVIKPPYRKKVLKVNHLSSYS